MKNTALLEVAIKAAMKAGRELRERYDDQLRTIAKESFRDIYSEADQAAEDCAIQVLRDHDPDIAILSEERGYSGAADAEDYWIVDALDGTVNYVHQVPFFSVSIAHVSKGKATAAAIYAPLVDDIYYAAVGKGAFKNQRRIQTPDKTPESSLFAASFSGKSFDPAHRHDEFITFGEINDVSRGCLRTGSAALNLAYLAEGRFNGCWGKAAKNWDIAAGLLIASEAGASIHTETVGEQKDRMNYIAAPGENFEFLKRHTAKCL
jgi:myo-inositol-1(or 4)-monophosphatase